MWTLEIETNAKGHSQILTQSDLVFINPGKYLHGVATLIGKSAENLYAVIYPFVSQLKTRRYFSAILKIKSGITRSHVK